MFGVIDEARAVFAAEAATRPVLEIEETEEPTETSETAETEKEEKASLGVSEDVADPPEDVALADPPSAANARVSAEDAPTDVSESDGVDGRSISRRRTTPAPVSETSDPSVPRVAPDAPEPFFEDLPRPAAEDAPGTNAAETTTDDVDDWLADD